MSEATMTCRTSRRRSELIDRINTSRANPTDDRKFNGIDYVDVIVERDPFQTLAYNIKNQNRSDATLLQLHFFNDVPESITAKNVWIRGGRRNRSVQVIALEPVTVLSSTARETSYTITDLPDAGKDGCSGVTAKVLQILVLGLEEAASYRLCLVELEDGCQTHQSLKELDPRHSEVGFTYRTRPQTDVDFRRPHLADRPTRPDPEVNYLAKDYASFRQLILDRLNQIMPEWRERHAADVGITLVELLAYVGDHLSYQQDAVATESYLSTARQRISVRRHARLVDYQLHEGCNSRTLVQVQVAADVTIGPQQLYFMTRPPDEFNISKTLLNEDDLPPRQDQRERLFAAVEVFEPLIEPPSAPEIAHNDLKDCAGIIDRLLSVHRNKEVADRHIQTPSPQLEHLVRLVQLFRPEVEEQLVNATQNWEPNQRIVSEHAEQLLINELNRIIREERLEQDSLERTSTSEGHALVACQAENEQYSADNRRFLDKLFQYELSSSRQNPRISLFAAHNEIHLYTWDEHECWLPKGATSATLWDVLPEEWKPVFEPSPVKQDEKRARTSTCTTAHHNRVLRYLSAGDILVFEEVRGPKTGHPQDADPLHKQAVRLTKVCPGCDRIKNEPIVEIEWHAEDALQFPLCISSVGLVPDCKLWNDVSIARGNLVVVDHGRTVEEPESGNARLDPDDPANPYTVVGMIRQIDCGVACHPPRHELISEPFQLTLRRSQLTFAQPLSVRLPVTRLYEQDVHAALPQIWLTGLPGTAAGKPLEAGVERLTRRLAHANDGELERDDFVKALRNITEPASRRVLAELLPPELAYWLNHLINFALRRDGQVTNKALEDYVVSLLQQATQWIAQPDLVDSRGGDRHFVVEMDNHRSAHLRFGDNQLGRCPVAGTNFHVRYRVGNGMSGSVGATALTHVVVRDGKSNELTGIRHFFPAVGAQPPQSVREAKLLAPHAYRQNQPRAIVPDDYANYIVRQFGKYVQAARADIVWIGVWSQVTVAIDPLESVQNVEDLLRDIEHALFVVRSIGHEVKVKLAEYVSLDIALTACIQPNYLRAQLRRELMELFSSRRRADGSPALFHPDVLTFGQPVLASRLIAAAQNVSGIESVRLDRFQRRGSASSVNVPDVLEIGPLQIAQLDNTGSSERGSFCLELRGGK